MIVCPTCTADAAAGYALSAYVKSVSATQFSVRISSNYTKSLSVGLMWLAFGT